MKIYCLYLVRTHYYASYDSELLYFRLRKKSLWGNIDVRFYFSLVQIVIVVSCKDHFFYVNLVAKFSVSFSATNQTLSVTQQYWAKFTVIRNDSNP